MKNLRNQNVETKKHRIKETKVQRNRETYKHTNKEPEGRRVANLLTYGMD